MHFNNSTQRRYDLDWLRVIATLLLVYFHTAAIFGHESFYVKNDLLSESLDFFIAFIHQWHMPLFFLLSGSATWFALGVRSVREYTKERFKRLFIPFLFGTLVIVPPQVYYKALSNPNYHDSYFQFYPHFFNGIRPTGNFEWGHLWFVVYLFVFSIIALPLFLYLRKEAGQRLISKLAHICEKPGAIFLLALPLATIEGGLRPRWPGFQNLYDDWANFFLYLFYFIYGYLICSNEKWVKIIDWEGKISLLLAVVGMTLLLGLWGSEIFPEPGYSPQAVLHQVLRGFNSWFWVVALLSLGRKYLNFNNKLLQYASEAAYPFYIIHQTVVVGIGFYVVQWNLTVIEKFMAISTASLIGAIALYEIFVKRFNLMRFLFGMKPKQVNNKT